MIFIRCPEQDCGVDTPLDYLEQQVMKAKGTARNYPSCMSAHCPSRGKPRGLPPVFRSGCAVLYHPSSVVPAQYLSRANRDTGVPYCFELRAYVINPQAVIPGMPEGEDVIITSVRFLTSWNCEVTIMRRGIKGHFFTALSGFSIDFAGKSSHRDDWSAYVYTSVQNPARKVTFEHFDGFFE